MMRKHVLTIILLLVIPFILAAILLSNDDGVMAQSGTSLSGRVYAGEVGDQDHPLQGVIVSLYGANNPYPDLGTLIISTTTEAPKSCFFTPPPSIQNHPEEIKPSYQGLF